jgi:hypothetical protein
MLAATIAVPVILAVVRIAVGQTGTEQPARLLATIVPAVALLTVIVSFALRQRIPARTGHMSQDDWWTVNMRTAVVLWSLAEGTGMLAGVSYFLTGHLPATLLAFGVAVALLLMSSPGRLAE